MSLRETIKRILKEETEIKSNYQKVIDRFESVYNNASEEDKKEIDSYFEK